MAIFEPQPLASRAAFKKTVYHCNWPGNYKLSYLHKFCKNKEAEIGKKQELIKKISTFVNSKECLMKDKT